MIWPLAFIEIVAGTRGGRKSGEFVPDSLIGRTIFADSSSPLLERPGPIESNMSWKIWQSQGLWVGDAGALRQFS